MPLPEFDQQSAQLAVRHERIARASRTGYAWFCVLSRIPPDWNPAVIEFPIDTYRSNNGSTGVNANGRLRSILESNTFPSFSQPV